MWTAWQTLSVSQLVSHPQTTSPTVIAAPVSPDYRQPRVQAQYSNNQLAKKLHGLFIREHFFRLPS
jgi:hypothetical protein